MAALVDAFGFTAGGLFFFVGQDVHAVFAVVGFNRVTLVVVRHIICFAMKGAVYVVVAAVWARCVSRGVRVPAACVGGCWGGGDGGGAARCGLGGGARCRCGWCGV